MAQIQETQLAAIKQLAGDLLNLVSVQVQFLQVGQSANLDGNIGNLVVPELKADKPMKVLETDDLLNGLQVVVLQINLLQVVQAED